MLFNKNIQDVLIGSLLGYGCISKAGRGPNHFRFKQSVIHAEYFFLLDRDRVVRGWYNGFDTLKQARLVSDIPLLMLEKRKKRSFKEFLDELFSRS